MNRYYLILTSLLFLTKFTHTGTDIAAELFTDPWERLEYIFIAKPEQQKSIYLSAVGACITGLTTGLIASHFTKNNTNKFTRVGLNTVAGLIPMGITYYFVTKFDLQNQEVRALEQFIKSWPENKKETPAILYNGFDACYRLYKTNLQEFNTQASNIIAIIKQTIYSKFPAKYGQQTKTWPNSFFTNKNFNLNSYLGADLGSTLQGIAKIIHQIKH